MSTSRGEFQPKSLVNAFTARLMEIASHPEPMRDANREANGRAPQYERHTEMLHLIRVREKRQHQPTSAANEVYASDCDETKTHEWQFTEQACAGKGLSCPQG